MDVSIQTVVSPLFSVPIDDRENNSNLQLIKGSSGEIET